MTKRSLILSVALNLSIVAPSAAQEVERQIAELRHALAREDTRSAQLVGEALVEMGRAAIEPASEVLKTAEEPAMHIVIMGVLAEIGGEEVVQPMIEMLRDGREPVRSSASILLQRMARPPNLIDSLVKELADEESGTVAAAVLTEIGRPSVESLLGALGDENEEVRLLAVLSLGQIGDERSRGPLNEALEDEDDVVSHNARLALRNFGRRFADWR